MRIGFLLDGFTGGGTARVTAMIGNEFVRSDICEVFALGYCTKGKPEIYDTLFPTEYAFSQFVSMRDAIIRGHYLSKVKEFVRKNRIEILIACGTHYFPIAVRIAKRMRIRSICWEHTNPKIEADFLLQKHARRYAARRSDCNVLLTKEALQMYREWFPDANNVQIYNPIDPELLAKPLRYNADSKRIISVGRLTAAKNYERLIRMAGPILKDYPDWSWDIYGDGSLRDELDRMIREHSLQGKVNLKGQVRDIYDRYCEYAFLVMTSRFEGFPMTLLEAEAFALPLVAFDISTGPAEIIENGVNGYICDPDSDQEMINRVRELMADPRLRQEMAGHSHEACRQFEPDGIIRQWETLFSSLS